MTSLIQVKIDKELKEQADRLFNELGLDTTTAIRIFLKQAINKDGLPFSIRRKKRDYDAEFYNEKNVKELRRRIDELDSGKVKAITKTIAELENLIQERKNA